MKLLKLQKTAALAIAAVCFSGAALAQGGISVIVDGTPVAFHGVGPTQMNGRVLVPLRGVLEQMGAYVDWEPAGQLVTATRGDTNIQLRIGERMARVNNNPVSLDVPAMIYHGSTMVPLRFMSEALGADVRWEPNQYAVVINTGTSGGSAQPIYPPPTSVHIDSLDMNRSGYIAPGSTIRFSMRGTPGGIATLTIPGYVRSFAMSEVSPGVYEATFMLPESAEGINASRLNASARLVVNGVEKVYQETPSGNVDTTPPALRSVTPAPDTSVTVTRPTITATFDETAGSVEPDSIVLRIDGRNVTQSASITANMLSYTPSVGYGPGRHDAHLEATDLAGNRLVKNWTFYVDAQAERVVRSFSVRGLENAQPGDVLRFTLVALPGGSASFSIGDTIRNKPMEEREAGRYVGTYTVRRGDDLLDQPITARFVARNGSVYTVDSTDRFDTNADLLDAPTILSPNPSDRAHDPLIVEGRAPVAARVRVHVDYSTLIAGAKLTGAVADVVVVADENGRFKTNPISLNTLINGRGTQFTITATTLGPNGQKSDPTAITISK